MDDARPEGFEGELRTHPSALVVPLPHECVACYVWRMLDEFGCNATPRWVRRWRDARAPRATALEQRLARQGGCCDCELFLNVWVHAASLSGARDGLAPLARTVSDLCHSVRRGSAQPCTLWVRRPRPWPRG
ncbi:MAG: DUF2695 domain-containing protein [Nocardioidaceae bacterium]